jgi:hypothetical protein
MLREEELRALKQQALGLLKWTPRREEYESPTNARSDQAKAPVTQQSAMVSKEAIDYLIHISQYPFLGATSRDRQLRISTYKGNVIRNELANAGLISLHRVTLGRRGGIITLQEVTELGYDYLDLIKVRASKPRGKGSFLHKFEQWVVYRWCQKHYPNAYIEIEDGSSGKLVDVGVHIPASLDGSKPTRLAFEVLVSGEKKELSNVAKDLEGFDDLVICCDNSTIAQRLRAEIAENLGGEFQSRVNFALLSELFDSRDP